MIFSKVEEILNSNNIDGARDEVAQISLNLRTVDASVQDFAALLALGLQEALEIVLGVLGRKLIECDLQVNDDVIWLFLAAVLSRQSITPDSSLYIILLEIAPRFR